MSTSIARGVGRLAGLIACAAVVASCGDDGANGTPEAELEVTASPLSPTVTLVHFTASGQAIAQNPGDPAIGGVGSDPVDGRSTITLRLPEGPATLRGYGQTATYLFDVDYPYYVAFSDLLPPYLHPMTSFGSAWDGAVYQWLDTCSTTVTIQAGRRVVTGLPCTAVTVPAWAAALPAARRPSLTRYLLNSAYTFDAYDRFAGSNGGNVAIVVIYTGVAADAVDVALQNVWGADLVRVFDSLPDPAADLDDVWSDPGTWPSSASVTTDTDGYAVAYLAAKPGYGTADVTVTVDGARLFARSVGFADVTVRAE